MLIEFLIGLSLITFTLSVTSLVYGRNQKKKVNSLLLVTKKQNLEAYLEEIKTGNENIIKKLSEIEKIYTQVRSIAQKSLQKTSLVRFNPFKDTGGDQSFVVCMLDNENSGFVITAIHSREGTRIYTKDIINGGSRLSLSYEEKQALSKALKNNAS